MSGIIGYAWEQVNQYRDALLIWDIEVDLDGDSYCVYRKSTFVNLQESTVGFGDSVREAIENLFKNEGINGYKKQPTIRAAKEFRTIKEIMSFLCEELE